MSSYLMVSPYDHVRARSTVAEDGLAEGSKFLSETNTINFIIRIKGEIKKFVDEEARKLASCLLPGVQSVSAQRDNWCTK